MEPATKKRLFLGALAGLVLLAVVTAAVVIRLGAGSDRKKPADAASGPMAPDNELLIHDIYSGMTRIPKFDLPLCQYDRDAFTEQDGFLRYDDPRARLGVDVSEHQGAVDWAAVREAGMDFAILRLGWRGSTQGFLNLDARFEENLQGAADAGLFVGVYFFSQAISEAEAEAEADFVLEALHGKKLAYPVAFDWEPPVNAGEGSYRVEGLTGEEVTRFAAAFCKKIKAAGYKPCVYTNKYMAYQFFDLGELKDYDLWYAEYQKAPSLYYDFRIWQYTESGSVPGIENQVDVDICFKPY